jgi:hypothetical protein
LIPVNKEKIKPVTGFKLGLLGPVKTLQNVVVVLKGINIAGRIDVRQHGRCELFVMILYRWARKRFSCLAGGQEMSKCFSDGKFPEPNEGEFGNDLIEANWKLDSEPKRKNQ